MNSRALIVVFMLFCIAPDRVAADLQLKSFGEIPIPTSHSGTSNVALGSSSSCSLWLSETAVDKVGCERNGKIVEFPLATGAAPGGLTEYDGSAIVVESGLPALALVQPNGKVAQVRTSPIIPGPPFSIVGGPDCAAWFVASGHSSFGRFWTTRGVRSVGTLGDKRPWKLAAVEDVPYLWFIDRDGEHVYKMDYKFALTETTVAPAQPVTSSNPSLEPFGSAISVASDETVWFSEANIASLGGPAIGRLTPTGDIKLFKLPTSDTRHCLGWPATLVYGV